MSLNIELFIERDGEELCVEVQGLYYKGMKGRMYERNGDPGYPDEPAEVEIINVTRDGRPFELTEAEQETALHDLMEEAESAFEEDYNDYDGEDKAMERD